MTSLQDVYKLQSRVEILKQKLIEAKTDIGTIAGSIAVYDQSSETLTHAMDLMKSLSFVQADRVRQFVANLVTAGVQDVFETDWEVLLIEEQKHGQRSLDIILKQGDIEASVPDGCGGGVSQVISVLVQIALVYLLRSKVQQIVFLDESLSHLARNYHPAAARVLKQVAEDLNIQIVLVAHSELLLAEADMAYEFVLKDGKTHVKRIRTDANSE